MIPGCIGTSDASHNGGLGVRSAARDSAFSVRVSVNVENGGNSDIGAERYEDI